MGVKILRANFLSMDKTDLNNTPQFKPNICTNLLMN